MRAKEARKILGITQKTLFVWVHEGKLHPFKVSEKRYEYDDDEVYALVGKGKIKHKTVTYSRVSTRKQKNDLESQQKRLYEWAISNGYTVDEQISDIKSGMSFAERQGFIKLIQMATQHEIGTLIIENRDRLTRFGFEMIEHTLKCLGVNVIVVSNVENKSYEKELTDDLISIIHYYSMKSYRLRKKLHNAELSIKRETQIEEKEEM